MHTLIYLWSGLLWSIYSTHCPKLPTLSPSNCVFFWKSLYLHNFFPLYFSQPLYHVILNVTSSLPLACSKWAAHIAPCSSAIWQFNLESDLHQEHYQTWHKSVAQGILVNGMQSKTWTYGKLMVYAPFKTRLSLSMAKAFPPLTQSTIANKR